MLAMTSDKRLQPGWNPNPNGRPPGTNHPLVLELRSRLTSHMKRKHGIDGYHPVIAMAEIACDANNPVDLRLLAHSKVAPYFQPQLQQTQFVGANGGPIEVKMPAVDALVEALLSGVLNAKDITGAVQQVVEGQAVEQSPA